MRFWLGVVQREHALRGVALGIAQTNHGAKHGIARMDQGDGFAYYSPKTSYPEGDPLREFTAIGIVGDGEPWQADVPPPGAEPAPRMGPNPEGFRPWRRRVDWSDAARATPIAPLLDVLDLTRGNPNWGFQLRRGFLEMTEHDFRIVAHEMGADTLVP
jgi:hypothetical protein